MNPLSPFASILLKLQNIFTNLYWSQYQLFQTRFVYFKTRKLDLAPQPDKRVCEPRAKTGVYALYKVDLKLNFRPVAQASVYGWYIS